MTKYSWEKLFTSEQDKYIMQARFLHSKGYFLNVKEDDLAKMIYEKKT